MHNAEIKNVRVSAIATVIPAHCIENKNNIKFPQDEVDKIIASTGVETRYIADEKTCASDLCYDAVIHLVEKLQIDLQEIDLVVFVSQTPDYILPATACVLQKRLGLKKEVMAFDINLGCSGYTYGLIVLAELLSMGRFKKALLLAGDTISKLSSPEDRSVAFLFGDAGSATLLEYDQNASPLYIDYGTDGNGYDKLCVPAGGFRQLFSPELMNRQEQEGGNIRAQTELFMNGADVFSFTLKEVPKTITACLDKAQLNKADIDLFVFHQANLFMLNHLVKKMGLPSEKVPLSLSHYGNTSVASIPLTLCQDHAVFKEGESKKLLLCGFGVGFSWASVILDSENLKVLPLIKRGDHAVS